MKLRWNSRGFENPPGGRDAAPPASVVVASRLRGHPRRSARAFTLVEIAIAMGIIGFALVAIIGILPAGLQVQRDNKEDTIINQEGTYFLEAIRNGAQDTHHLTNLVSLIELREIANRNVLRSVVDPVPADQVISFLSRPSDMLLPPNGEPLEVKAIMRPSSGSAVDNSTEVGFQYQLIVRNFAFTNASATYSPAVFGQLPNYLREVRLEFRWPVLPGGKVGSGRQVFRALISGAWLPDPRILDANGNPTDPDRWLCQR